MTDLRQARSTRAISRRKGLNLAPAYAPNGSRMILTLSKYGNPDLFAMDMQGQILAQLTSGAGINVSPSFSPDGRQIAFVSDRSGRPNVYVMSAGGGPAKRLTFKCSENSEPAWSPKGDEIAFTGLLEGHYQLFIMGCQWRQCAPDYKRGQQLRIADLGPRWSLARGNSKKWQPF